jgi:hypothetical protein
MGTDILDLDDAAATFDRDTKAWRMRLSLYQPRDIARALGCSLAEVNLSIARMSMGVSKDIRAMTVALELERLDELERGFYKDALPSGDRRGSADAAVIVLRCTALRMSLLGLAAPPRADPLGDIKEPQTSTEELQNAIDRLVGKKDRTIDGEVVRENGDA